MKQNEMKYIHFREESEPKAGGGEPGKAVSFKLSLEEAAGR